MNITPMAHTSRQKSPVLLLMGKKDFYTTASEVSHFLNEIPAKDKKVKYFDAGHILPNEYRIDAIDWINSFN